MNTSVATVQASSTETPVRLRVLMSAHEFSPAQGSECGVGWHIATRVARYHDVTLLCASGSQVTPFAYKQAFEAWVREHGQPEGLRVVFVDQPPFGQFLASVNKKMTGFADGTGNKLLFLEAMKSWNRTAAREARRLGLGNFDVVHHVTPISHWSVNPEWSKAETFCWGPVGGLYTIPLNYSIWLGWRFALVESAKAVSFFLGGAKIRRALKNAAVVWALSKAETERFASLWQTDYRQTLDVGTESINPGTAVVSYDGSRPLRLCWSGRHAAHKALPILLRAMANSSRDRYRLVVLGAGPMTEEWKKMASELGLDAVIEWKGTIPREKALFEMSQADVLVHTSLREAAASVILEALSLGKPVVCHDACGMGVAVNDTCGLKIPLQSPAESIVEFQKAMERLVQSPELLRKLSEGALRRSAELTWDAKAEEIAQGYRDAVNLKRKRA